jgi:methionyl-tRNA formyltransferase
MAQHRAKAGRDGVRVVFFGNHTVGVEALTALSQAADVVGVVAHPDDPEDGVRYQSVHGFACERGWNVVRSTGKDPALERFVANCAPDLLWITDYRYVLPPAIIDQPRHGAVNLHPSLLPKYRGRAPINWAIICGETRLGLTAHFVDEGVDSGDIIEQASYGLTSDQDVGDALQALYPLYRELTKRVIAQIIAGIAPRIQQDHSQATIFPRRKPEDGRIDWRLPMRSIWNLVRALAHPYPGAFTSTPAGRLTIWKARPSNHESKLNAMPGTIINIDDIGVHVQCGDHVLALIKTGRDGELSSMNLQIGMALGEGTIHRTM